MGTDITASTPPSRPNGSLTSYGPGNVRAAMAERLTFSEAIGKVGEMLKSYPPSELDHSGYIGVLASCLLQYPKCIAIRCMSITGVAAKCKFKPTIADVTAWCEHELDEMRRITDREDTETRWKRERDEACERERERLAMVRSPENKAAVAAKCKATIDALAHVLGRKTEADLRLEAEATLARYLEERDRSPPIAVTPQLAAILAP